MSVGIVTPSNLSVPLSHPFSETPPDEKAIENSKGMKYLNSKSEGGS